MWRWYVYFQLASYTNVITDYYGLSKTLLVYFQIAIYMNEKTLPVYFFKKLS